MQLELFPKMVEIVPNWSPLVTFCEKYGKMYAFRQYGHDGLIEVSDFMWMHSWGGIQCYKHKMNRRYLNIDSDGKYYRYLPKYNEYDKISKFEALTTLFG